MSDEDIDYLLHEMLKPLASDTITLVVGSRRRRVVLRLVGSDDRTGEPIYRADHRDDAPGVRFTASDVASIDPDTDTVALRPGAGVR